METSFVNFLLSIKLCIKLAFTITAMMQTYFMGQIDTILKDNK